MNKSTSQLNSILVIPIRTEEFVSGITVENDWDKTTLIREQLKKVIALKSRALQSEDLKVELWDWSLGGLQKVDFDNTPGEALTRKLAASLPPHLLKLLGFSRSKLYRENQTLRSPNEKLGIRFSENLISSEDAEEMSYAFFHKAELENQNKIKPFNLTAVEFLVLPEDQSYAYLILHLSCTLNVTNQSRLQELNQLHNKPLKELLDAFFQVTESQTTDPSMGVQGLIPKHCRTGILISFTEGEDKEELVDYGHLLLSLPSNAMNLARFRVRYTLIGILVSLQRDELRKLTEEWPSLSKENLDKLVDARLLLGSFMNRWWWPQLVLNQATQRHYMLLQSVFGLDSQLNALRSETEDLWDVMKIQNADARLKSAQRLEKFVVLLTFVGLTPIWFNIFDSFIETVAAIGMSGLLAAIGFWVLKRNTK
jgi:hypothetical protein